MYALNLNNNKQVLSVCTVTEYTPKNMPRVESFPKNVINYKFIDNDFIYSPIEVKEDSQSKIQELKQKLSETDYIAIKYAEGWISEEEYAPIKIQRQSWRNEINELEDREENE